MPSKNNSQAFPIKYVNTLKKAMVCCDKKQYKDGIKLCKKILEFYPKHGETLTVMGLLLYLKGSKDEGIQKAKLGLGYDLKNANSWRIYGMLMQEIKEYEKAVSSLRSSLKVDPNQFHLLRDMSRIQVHIRDFVGCKETRLMLLKMKPNLRNCWLGYAVACDLSFDLDSAIRVMHEFRKAQSEQTMSSENIDVEYSQLIVYHIELLLRSPSLIPQKILTTLSSCERLISDKLFVLETKAKLFQSVGSMEESFKCLYELAKRNCEEPRYFQQMVEVLKIDEVWHKKVSFFHRMLQIFSSSETLQILILESSNDDETFLTEFRSFFDRKLSQSVPNIFSLTRSLYSESFKIHIIEQVALDFLKQHTNSELQVNGIIRNHDYSRKSKIDYYLAQHYYKLNALDKSVGSINKCLSSSPKFIDAMLFKCSILKRVGLTSEASALASDACKLNKTDRYLNSMCSLYYLANGQEFESEVIQKSYSKDLAMETHLKDLQVIWYIVELSRMHFAKSDWASSIKYVNLVYKIFTDFSEDLLDFHGYSLRKCTLSPYIDLMNYSMLTFRHHRFFSIAKIAIRIYLTSHKPVFGIYSLSATFNKQTLSKESFSHIYTIVQKLVHFNPDDFESRELALLFYSSTQNPLLMLRELLAMCRLQPDSLSSTFALVNFLHSAVDKVIVMEDRIVSVCEILWEKCIRGVSMKSMKSTAHNIVTLIDERFVKCGSEVCDFRGFLNLLLAKRYFMNDGANAQIPINDLKSLLDTISNEKYIEQFIENLRELENIVLLMQKNNVLSMESSEAFTQSLQKMKVLRQSTIF